MGLYYRFFLSILLCCTIKVQCSLWDTLLEQLLFWYKRPVTILYVSGNPQPLPIGTKDVVVVWSDCHDLKEQFQRDGCDNYILLTGDITKNNVVSLAECEHFDIAIIDSNIDYSFILQKKAHLADHMLFLTSGNLTPLVHVGREAQKDIFLMSSPKTILLKNWWQSCSWHKNYIIVSNFEEKFFIKPKEYTKENEPKKYNWIPGINLYTFLNLGGAYPTKKYIREIILEIFNPLTHKDFGAANIIIQGTKLKAIDYDDTIYGDPYGRLEKTIEVQLGIQYKRWEYEFKNFSFY